MPRFSSTWVADFRFSDGDRQQLAKLGLSGDAILQLEGELGYLKSYAAAVPPGRRAVAKNLDNLSSVLAAAHAALTGVDDLSLNHLRAHGMGRHRTVDDRGVRQFTMISPTDLKDALGAYTRAAKEAAEKLREAAPTAGADPEADDNVTGSVAEALRCSSVPLDGKAKGAFSTALQIAFAALGIHKAEVRNDVRRYLSKRCS